MMVTEVIRCRGHHYVRATHRTTLEVTAEEELTPRGECIIGIGADKGARDLSVEFRRAAADDRAVIDTILETRGISVHLHSHGSAKMTLDHPTDLVWRRSSFVCGRTIGIQSDHTAATLPRELIELLRKGTDLTVTLTATLPDQAD
jgi:hypothetical protein